MTIRELEVFVKRFSLPLMVIGGAVAALGLSGYGGNRIFMGWSDSDRIKIAVGVGLFILGMFIRKSNPD
ncbi:MAG: hypothetical protein ACYCSP_00585 [Acidobacteriaceae bacterium]